MPARWNAKKKTILQSIGLAVFFFLIGTLILPVFDNKKSALEQSRSSLEKIEQIGEEAQDGPYHWIDRSSYGEISHWAVNKTYAKNFLKNNMQWRLQASPNGDTWYDADQFLDVGLTWNENDVNYKVLLTLNTTGAPMDLYYRFDLACNKSLKKYTEVNNYEWQLTVPTENDMDYTIVFNWSDIANLVQNNKITFNKGVTDNFFWFRIKTVNKIAPDFEFIIDPEYGVIADADVSEFTFEPIQAAIGSRCNLLQINETEYYVVVASDSGQNGQAYTLRVYEENGTIQQSVVDNLEFDSAYANYIGIAHRPGTDVYVTAYQGSSSLEVTTFRINDDGTFNVAGVIDTDGYTGIQGTNVDMGFLYDDIVVIAFNDYVNYYTRLVTFQINADGSITNNPKDTQAVASTGAGIDSRVSLCFRSDDADSIIMAFNGAGNDGYIYTFDVASNGLIDNSADDSWEFDTSFGPFPDVHHVDGNYFILVCPDYQSDGWIRTFQVSTSGSITKSFTDSYEFSDATTTQYLTIFTINNASAMEDDIGVYGVAYLENAGTDGIIQTFNVSTTGDIGASAIDSYTYESTTLVRSTGVAYTGNDIYLVTYQGSSADGIAKTLDIETYKAATCSGSNEYPANDAYNVSLTPTCNVTVTSTEGSMDVYFYTSYDGISWATEQINSSVDNGSISFVYTNASNLSTLYYWNYTIDDGTTTYEPDEYLTFETTPYADTFFNDTFSTENWINSSNNMTFENGWLNFTAGSASEGATGYISFAYHMYGVYSGTDYMGDLYVKADDGEGGWDTLWERHGTQQAGQDSAYLFANVSLENYTSASQTIRFHGVTGSDASNGWCSDMAVDTVTVGYEGTVLDTETFESSTGDWDAAVAGDDMDWTRDASGTPSSSTGPTTGANGSSYYMFTEASSPNYPSKDAYMDITVDLSDSEGAAGSSDGWVLSKEIFKPVDATWNKFYAAVNDTNSCSFAIVAPEDTNYNITSGLTGDGDDISSVTNASIMIFGNFSDMSVNMASWNITWSEEAPEPPENSPPFTYSPSPANGSTGVSVDLNTLSITIEDPDGDTFNYTINATCVDFGENDVSNGSKGTEFESCWDYSTTYKWWVNTTDGNNSNTSWYIFTTEITWYDIDTTINGTFYHSSTWAVIDDTINGSFYNTTTWKDIDTTINGSFWNETIEVANPSITLNRVSNGPTDYTNLTSNAVFETHIMHVNLTITAGSGSIDSAKMHRYDKDGDTWYNDTDLTPDGGDYYVNTNEYFDTNWSFDIYVNNTDGGETTFQWTKPDYTQNAPARTRKYVYLGYSGYESVDYTPLYLNDDPIYDTTGDDHWKNQRIYWHDQWSDNGGADSNMFSFYRPSGSEYGATICAFHGLEFNQSISLDSLTVNNIYYHLWVGSVDTTPPYSSKIGWNNQTDSLSYDDAQDTQTWTVDDAREQSTASYNWHGLIYNYHMFANVINLSTPEDFTTNNIYNLTLIPTVGSVIWEDHFIGFMIINLPANNSLRTWDNDSDGLSDWTELFVTFTDPWHSDTDEDGVEDLIDSRPNWVEDDSGCSAIPVNVSTVNGTTWINVTYDFEDPTTAVMVRRGTTGYPMNTTQGTLVSNSSNSYANDTGLDSDTTYYYSLWSWSNEFQKFSLAFNYTTGTTLSPGASWQVINNTINGSFYNVTSWHDIDTSINGSFYNVTSWHDIDTTINGTFYHSSTWTNVDTTINGSFYNVTTWVELDTTINGTFYHSSTWTNVDTTINGSFYNITTFKDIDTTINGTFYNLTFWVEIDNTINGSFYNLTTFQIINNTINGSFYNLTTFQIINNTINGSFYNVTSWHDIDTTINGTFWNLTYFSIIDDTINGSFYNVTTWVELDTTINGSFYNVTSWSNINTDINGSFFNLTVFQTIDDTINGIFYNETVKIWQNIDTSINGSFYNITAFYIIDDTINGSFYNTSDWITIDDTINGTFWNWTFKIIILSNEFPTNESMGNRLREILNVTVNHYNGSSMNVTWYYGNSSENCTNELGISSEIDNETIYMAHPFSEQFYTQYYWRLNVTDEYGFYLEEIFNYRTGGRDWTPGLLPNRNYFWIIFGSLGIIGLFGIMRRKRRKKTRN